MFVYADNAATTCVSKTALDAMMPYLTKVYGNPSSLHTLGQEAKEALDAAGHLVEALTLKRKEISGETPAEGGTL